MLEFENLKEIIAKTLVGKQLIYINSKSYNNATIIDVDMITTHENSDHISITITIEQPFKNSNRKRKVSFIDDDQITIK